MKMMNQNIVPPCLKRCIGDIYSDQSANGGDTYHQEADDDLFLNCNLDDLDSFLIDLDFRNEDSQCGGYDFDGNARLSPIFALNSSAFNDDLGVTDTSGTDNFPSSTDVFLDTTEDIIADSSDEYNEDDAESSTMMFISPPSTSTAPATPKGYVSAFNFFVVSERARVLAANPDLQCSNNAMNKLLGETWKALPKAAREAYVCQANDDKRRYLREVALYNSLSPQQIIPRINPPPGCDMNGESIEAGWRKKRRQNAEQSDLALVKRPLTAYSTFAQQEKQFVAGLDCGDLQRRMGRYFGIRWKTMDAAEKELYYSLEEVYRRESQLSA